MSARTAVETIQAAIEKLEEAEALPWPCASWTQNAVRHIARNCEIECYDDSHEDELTWDRYETGPALFMLSQTIDAQLHILQETVFQLSGAPEARGFIGNEFNLIMQLALAILGESS